MKIVIQLAQTIILSNRTKTRISQRKKREEVFSINLTVTLKLPVMMSQNQIRILKNQLIQ
jgi:hypothetical protein